MKKIYKQLTNIDIETQKNLWNDRGKGYYGEYLVFCDLYKHLSGMGKLLMNLKIPTENNKTTEIDLLLIHETGIYVFEIKHYKGTIYGRETDEVWTQYFRTTKNSHFKNPIIQNKYHINALTKLFPQMPIYSIIVFTNNDCTIKVTHNENLNNICTLYELPSILRKRFKQENTLLTAEDIDKTFTALSKYSPMQEPVLINAEERSFLEWIQPTINNLTLKKQELETEKQMIENKEKELKKKKRFYLISTVIIIIFCYFFTYSITTTNKTNYDNELSKFKQNFLHVDEIDNNYIKNLNEYVTVTNQNITTVSSYEVSFKATLNINNDIYGVALNEDSKYIVMTSSNKVYEYNVFGKHLHYNRIYNVLGKGIKESGDLKQAQFFGVNKDEITYIKLTNLEMFKLDVNRTLIKDNLELELYKK